MFVPTGIAIGVPLTFLQSVFVGLHTGAPAFPSSMSVASNFALGHSIYDADRLRDVEKERQFIYPYTTKMSLVVPTIYYCQDIRTSPLVIMLFALHFGYADLKPYISPIKPLFVSFFWVIAVYYAPLIISSHSFESIYDLATPSVGYFTLAAWSNIADVSDIEEDGRNDIRTFAVLNGERKALNFSISAVILSVIFHLLCENYSEIDVIFDVMNTCAMFGTANNILYHQKNE